ncbi:MAG TPA: MBL fold metallo-hydrolase, partial [Alphaproteobacteria bacterium]|nr:MBL fold metallo-hydrolase [Alphaproteobacteria bacterium]
MPAASRPPTYDTTFDAAPGEAVAVAPGVVRITAPNAGPFTFRGTNTFVLGGERVAIVDPGPDERAHREALLAHIGGRPVEAILLTHT